MFLFQYTCTCMYRKIILIMLQAQRLYDVLHESFVKGRKRHKEDPSKLRSNSTVFVWLVFSHPKQSKISRRIWTRLFKTNDIVR